MRTEEEVQSMIDNMVKRTKGRYITQGVTFNKSCPRQMDLLKKALMSSISFSGLGKELLALRFGNGSESIAFNSGNSVNVNKTKNIGNFV